MPERTERYPAMDQGKANNECVRRNAQHFTTCPGCQGRIALHCTACEIQITGCLCTEVDRFGKEAEGIKQIYDRMAERVGEEEAHKQMRQAGLWIPGLKGEI